MTESVLSTAATASATTMVPISAAIHGSNNDFVDKNENTAPVLSNVLNKLQEMQNDRKNRAEQRRIKKLKSLNSVTTTAAPSSAAISIKYPSLTPSAPFSSSSRTEYTSSSDQKSLGSISSVNNPELQDNTVAIVPYDSGNGNNEEEEDSHRIKTKSIIENRLWFIG
jgi:hypothetical protein